jgi:hypothetical protein
MDILHITSLRIVPIAAPIAWQAPRPATASSLRLPSYRVATRAYVVGIVAAAQIPWMARRTKNAIAEEFIAAVKAVNMVKPISPVI